LNKKPALKHTKARDFVLAAFERWKF